MINVNCLGQEQSLQTNTPICFSKYVENFIKLRNALTAAGFDQSMYAAHSFCIGAATTASGVGISDAHIKMLGRWESSAYQIYVRTPRQDLANLAKKLVSTDVA